MENDETDKISESGPEIIATVEPEPRPEIIATVEPEPRPEIIATVEPEPEPDFRSEKKPEERKKKLHMIAGGAAVLVLLLLLVFGIKYYRAHNIEPEDPRIVRDDEGRIIREPLTLEDGSEGYREYDYIADYIYATDLKADHSKISEVCERYTGELVSKSWFNEAGYETYQETYDDSGNLATTTDTEYDEDGFVTSRLTKDGDGQFMFLTKYYYENGLMIRSEEVLEDGSVDSCIVMAYNDHGDSTQTVHISEGNVNFVYLSDYNDDQLKMKERQYDVEGMLTTLILYTYHSDGSYQDSETHSSSDDDWKEISAGEILQIDMSEYADLTQYAPGSSDTEGNEQVQLQPTGDGNNISQPHVFYNNGLYAYYATGFDENLPDGYKLAGQIESEDDSVLPTDELSGCQVKSGQNVYALEENQESIYVEYETGYALFTLKKDTSS